MKKMDKECTYNIKGMYQRDVGRRDGITLIALVVTIIVLLILAGISIMMLTGESRDSDKC